MGRHRRSAPGTAPTPPAPGAGRHRGARRSPLAPVRTGLLSVSAAVAVGAVAMATGLLPGGPTLSGSNDPAGGVRADAPSGSALETQGSPSASPVERGTTPADRGDDRPHAPSTTPSKTPGKSSPAPSTTPSKQPGSSSSGQATGSGNGSGKENGGSDGKGSSSSHKPTTPPAQSADPSTPESSEKAAARQVLALVNQERSKVGCEPVTADPKLTQLAQDFTDDMALRGFFDHLDPDGDTPWERAEQVGILNLGGENIARGQQDAQAVMDSWMDSPGHRANILNCSYKTLGVGANFGDGDGPWWTQDFGY
ncbi:CAP domain-containing protein [Streptomyces sp. ME19-01-6]|uniref:CAP domain-containing protein n=1 Tax=Streptomyces sp. ME19-01-6 TaxID=3028686 RepID=UPI0029B10800|nr:CAP domain-containing protein [Streptomyces sp. ME19-01-6]